LLSLILFWMCRVEYRIDDAYITYRYSYNLAHGLGARYYEGENSCGYSTPGFFLLLAAGEFLGIASHWTGWILGGIGQAAVAFFLFRIHSGKSAWVPSALAALLVATNVSLLWAGQIGMETAVFVALVFATIVRASSESKKGVGPLLAFSILLRLDGLVLAPVLLLFRFKLRPLLREALTATVIVGAWFAFARLYYGSFLPNSIHAKVIYHEAGFLACFGPFAQGIAYFPRTQIPLFALSLLGAGVGIARRESLVVALLVFLTLYVAGFCSSGIMPFTWYLVPSNIVAIAIAGRGLTFLWEKLAPNRSRRLLALLVVLFSSLQTLLALDHLGKHDAANRFKNEPYEKVSDWIRANLKTGSTVLVGETGYMGYLLPEYRIIDSSGINCIAVLDIRKRHLSNVTRPSRAELDHLEGMVLRDIIEEFNPDCFTALIRMPGISVMRREKSLRDRYEVVHGSWDDASLGRGTLLAVRRDHK